MDAGDLRRPTQMLDGLPVCGAAALDLSSD